ncbi:MAG: hypothetical protein LBJ67_10910 [Planctomycetaceae bacterium]|jgi:hypothetical protein|nr:hypothetical protein [Planctomycetaceae bacterium]
MTHRQYGLLFLFLAIIAFVWAVIGHYIVVRAAAVWLAVSCFWTAAAFVLHSPEMVLGKKQNRICFLPFVMINAPFLLAYWLVWTFRHLLLRHEPVHHIHETEISISCWPPFHVAIEDYDFVIDVTAEMPKFYRTQTTPINKISQNQNQHPLPKYISLPNLDGVPLDRLELPSEICRGMRILVHCAQGRGRSAVMACLLLVKLQYAETGEEAFQMLKAARSKVHVSRYQMRQIKKL